jgi:hypothetical protein
MKKYLLGLFAIALAIGFSAFTKPSNFDSFTFKYVGPTTYSSADVTLKSNWVQDVSCSEDFADNEFPCSFTATGTSLVDINNHPVSTITLSAAEGDASNKFILTDVRQSGSPIYTSIVNLELP